MKTPKSTPAEGQILAPRGVEAMPTIEQRYLTRAEAANYLRLTVAALDNLKWQRKLPYIKPNRRIYFDRHDLDAYMAEHKHPAHEGLRDERGWQIPAD